MSFGNKFTLSTGAKIPQLALGTWLSKPGEVEATVEFAVRNNYRHLDLAMVYQNQGEVGAALKKVIPSVVKREDLFLTSKLWNSAHQTAEVAKELDETLRQLGTDYLDLYLIHWPVAFPPGDGLNPPHPTKETETALDTETTLVETWKAMTALLKSKVRAIGVCNFNIDHLQAIIAATGVVPAVNQIEIHPLLPQTELVAYCKEQGIHVTAYGTFGVNCKDIPYRDTSLPFPCRRPTWVDKPKLSTHPVVEDIAKRLNATPQQVLIAWGAYGEYSLVPKLVQEDRIITNFQQVKLSKEDYDAISALGNGNRARFNIPFTLADCPSWDINIFDEPEEKPATHKVKIH
ncbi:NADP-dependent oxidoreductase domain-containing protein [Collybia nuda]|uniref:NADP-dependent oxidoreductase domain-containing protein n=1 Tax=Collybia nuda TaxID=64659 RepID=A0A9P6CMD8_9AGAR|nr:NADP-dependent oxidoreductase domain-containing protein [Collybia nuda]